jgi:dolichol-phosphate mannosyltransferase
MVLAQGLAAAAVLTRLAQGRERRPPLTAAPTPPRMSVIVPARDEEHRIGRCLAGLAGEGAEVVVVDDRSTDRTAQVARDHGARVVEGERLPDGWVGKSWALQQGLEAVSGDVVVCLDADTRPRPGLLGALAAIVDDDEVLLSAGGRFVRQGALERHLHAAMLASLVYRFGPQDGAPPRRLLVNGQCLAFRREPLLAAGGFGLVRGHLTDDAALGRALRARGWSVRFADASDLLDVEMYDSFGGTWSGWGRSIALADVTPPAQRAADVATLWLTCGLPVLRALRGRPTRLDVALLVLRTALGGALGRSYDGPVLLAPLMDPLVCARVTWSAARPSRTWRGRTYAA